MLSEGGSLTTPVSFSAWTLVCPSSESESPSPRRCSSRSSPTLFALSSSLSFDNILTARFPRSRSSLTSSLASCPTSRHRPNNPQAHAPILRILIASLVLTLSDSIRATILSAPNTLFMSMQASCTICGSVVIRRRRHSERADFTLYGRLIGWESSRAAIAEAGGEHLRVDRRRRNRCRRRL